MRATTEVSDPASPPGADPGETPGTGGAPAASGGAGAPGTGGARRDASAGPDLAADAVAPPAAPFFRTEAIHRIEITIDAAEWQAFLTEHATVDSSVTLPWHRASFRIDGTPLAQVGFKTFGYGSREANLAKPNLNLDIDRNLPAQSLGGVTRMRLKNNGQDPSGLRQALVYEALRAAGALAPRSTFAELVVNGEPYGFYFVEETFSKSFVRERTGNDDGAAYEASWCHGFVAPRDGGCSALVNHYERSFNPLVGAGEDLAAVCAVMNGPADQLVARLDPLIRLDEWIDVLAIDTALAGDVDGYSVAGNNFRLYHDTALGQLRLVMLGPDVAFDPERLPEPDPLAPAPSDGCRTENPDYRDVFLQQLVATPAGRARYQQAVRRLRTGVMGAEAIKRRVDALWAIVGDRIKAQPPRLVRGDPEASKEAIKRYVDERWPALAAAGF